MSSNRTRDNNGFLLVKGCPISSYGIFDYSAAQLGLPGDPNRIVKVFRPEEAVSDAAALESFRNLPLIDDHEMLSGFAGDKSASAPEDYGMDGVLTGNVYYEAPWMRGDLKVFTRRMQQLLNSGKKDLSLGYGCDFNVSPGVFNGQPYEVVQTNLRGNHIALVDRGRVPGARVLDGLIFDSLTFEVVQPSDEESEMKRSKQAMDNAVAQLKALLPALEQFLNEEASEPAHQEGAAVAGQEGAAAGGEGQAVATGGEGAAVAAEPSNDDLAAQIEGGGEGAVAGGEGAVAGGEGAEAGAVAAGGEGAAAAGGEADLPALISQVEAVLAKIKAAVGGGEGTDEGEHAQGVSGQEGAATGAAGEATQTADQTEGLEGGEGQSLSVDGEGEGAAPANGGKASPGPTEGSNATANDAALRGFYADLAAKAGIYDRLSQVVGAFDHAAMDAHQVASYGVKKLGLKCAAGQERVALDAYLTGVEKAAKDTKQRLAAKAADSAVAGSGSTELDAYLNLGK